MLVMLFSVFAENEYITSSKLMNTQMQMQKRDVGMFGENF
jgi:hypothetical protein